MKRQAMIGSRRPERRAEIVAPLAASSNRKVLKGHHSERSRANSAVRRVSSPITL